MESKKQEAIKHTETHKQRVVDGELEPLLASTAIQPCLAVSVTAALDKMKAQKRSIMESMDKHKEVLNAKFGSAINLETSEKEE